MSRATLHCVVFIVLGFGIGRWLSGALDSPKRIASKLPHTSQQSSANADAKSSAAVPTSALARVIELVKGTPGIRQDAELYDALNGMRAEDFREFATRSTEEIRGLIMGSKIRGNAILDRWFGLDPESAKAFAVKACQPGGPTADEDVKDLIAASAARSDPKWALEHLLRETDYTAWGNINKAVMYEVAKGDSTLAKEWMKRTENTKLHTLLMPGYIKGIAESDPLAALDIAISEKGFERLNLVPEAINAAAKQGRGMVLEALAKIEDPGLRQNAAIGALRVLAQETQTHLLQFFDDHIGQEALGAIKGQSFAFNDVVEANPAATARWAASLPLEHRSEMMGKVLDRWKEIDPEAAKEWVEQQAKTSSSNSAEEASALADLSRLWSAGDLLEAGKARDAVFALNDVRTNGPLAGNLAWQLSNREPEAVAQLALSLPECEAREAIASTLAANWIPRNPNAATEWVEKLPPGASRNAALTGMIQAVAEHDPQSASQWVGLYTDSQKRLISVGLIYGQWRMRNSGAAREWLNSLPFVDERWKTKFFRQNP